MSNRKHICVIGAGPAGLRVTKDLIEMGHTVSCFEKMPKLGGVFLKTYDNMRFVSSSLLSAWSDYSDGQEHSPTYWTADEYISYCEKFAEKYDLLKHIYFCHEIEEVRKCSNTGKWIVTVQEVIPDTKYKRCKALATVKATDKALALLRVSRQFGASRRVSRGERLNSGTLVKEFIPTRILPTLLYVFSHKNFYLTNIT